MAKKAPSPRKFAKLNRRTPLGMLNLALSTSTGSPLTVSTRRTPTIELIIERTRKESLQLSIRATGTTIKGVIPEPIAGPIIKKPKAEPFFSLKSSLIREVAGA
ncbi:103aa long hypothetical protein [Pyrococcus horikoshii OT3]|uniref:Uncharacterized protein n=1 Tax=Pyrococcus horikoshii (strain ATCC 700860 / DSM 12428 / JCM 9974 / NBRC 100139 / OT-3) TaxID=70601 RepID=O58993_PYRHO|nr:103aa long hypothetical protein [Pyrococcus horikoshii OT3]